MMMTNMEKLENFIKNYDSSQYEALPKFMKRRVDALKKLQLEQISILHQYHKELQELELKYEKLYQPFYEKRYKIISGEHEPSDDECQLPASIVENAYNGDQENKDASEVATVLTEEQENNLKSKINGIPGFWLGCLTSTYNFNDSIESYDKQVLRHLTDIRLSYELKEEFYAYKLEFVFDENPYFTNKVLTKTYYLKLKPDEKDPFSYEGFEVTKSEGCEINWNPGKDVTTQTMTVKQQNKVDGRTREKKKEIERDSFFYFFKPPKLPEGGEDDIDDELGAVMAVDFELGEVIRQSIIPKAPLYYIGYLDEDDDADSDDDEDDDDEEEDSDEYDYESDLDEDESEASHDSLNKNKDKKPIKKGPKSAEKSS